MPTKRTPRQRRLRPHLTAEAIAAFHAGDHAALHAALQLGPWEASPLAVDGRPTPLDSTAWAASWPKALALRAELGQQRPKLT